MYRHTSQLRTAAQIGALMLGVVAVAGVAPVRSAPLSSPSAALRLRASTGPKSLLAIAATQLTQARAKISGAYLFELDTSILPRDIASGSAQIRFVEGDFAVPDNDVRYVRVREWFTGTSTRRSVDTLGFVRVPCTGGAPQPTCGSDTGKAESRLRHLPLSGWKVDMGGLVRILRTAGYAPTNYSAITVTTAGRAMGATLAPEARLAALRATQAVILVRESARPRYHFIFINAASGAVIAKGTALAPPIPS